MGTDGNFLMPQGDRRVGRQALACFGQDSDYAFRGEGAVRTRGGWRASTSSLIGNNPLAVLTAMVAPALLNFPSLESWLWVQEAEIWKRQRFRPHTSPPVNRMAFEKNRYSDRR